MIPSDNQSATNTSGKHSSRKRYFRLFQYFTRKDEIYLISGLIFAAGAGVINPINVLVFRDVVNNFTSKKFSYTKCHTAVIYFVILGFTMLFATFVQAFLLSVVAKRLSRTMCHKCFPILLTSDNIWYDNRSRLGIAKTFQNHVNMIEQALGIKLGEFVQNMCGLCAGVIAAFTEGWKLSLVASATLPLILLSFGMFGCIVNYAVYKERASYEKARMQSHEVLRYVRTVVSYGMEEQEVQRYHTELVNSEYRGIKRSLLCGAILGATGFAFFSAAGLMFWYGVTLMVHENYTGGSVITVFINILLGSVYLGNALPSLPYIKAALLAAEEICNVMESQNTTDEDTVPSGQHVLSSCTITLHDISFAYPTDLDNLVLRHVNFNIPRGQKLALMGPSGAGKTTLLNLLLRSYPPKSGCIMASSMNLESWDVRKYRDHFGYVASVPVLFTGTIAYNIRLGRLDATDEELVRAAQTASVHEFIQDLNDGYDTPVSHLSSRAYLIHRWLITLARAMVRNPSFLLLDYPDDDLQWNRRHHFTVLQAVEKCSEGRTVIVSSRCPSLVKNADHIVVLDKGLVKQTGSHSELMNEPNGLYAAMMNVYDREERTGTMDTAVPDVLSSDSMEGKRILKPKTRIGSSYFVRTLGMNKPEIGYIIGGCICSMIAGFAQPSFAVLYSEVFDVFIDHAASEKIVHRIEVIGGLMALVGLSRFIACFGQGYFFGVSGERLVRRLRTAYFDAILRQEITWFNTPDHQADVLTANLAETVTRLRAISGMRIGNLIEVFALIIFSVVVAFICSWQLTLVVCAFVPFVILGSLVRLCNLTQTPQHSATDVLIDEALIHSTTLDQLDLAVHYTNRYLDQLNERKRAENKASIALAVVYSFTQSAGIFTLAAVFELGAQLLMKQSLSVINLFRAFVVLNMGSQSLDNFFTSLPDMKMVSKSAEVIFSTIERNECVSREDGLKPSEPAFTGKVTFDHVTCKSDDEPTRNRQYLQDFSCTIESRKLVGFVGKPGCVHSEIFDLIQRFYDPSPSSNPSHAIYFDQWNIQQLAPSWIRAQSAWISHECHLFSRSIKENIAYGTEAKNVNLDLIIEAARMANIHEFINTLPEGYDTVINQDRLLLSPGQSRRIILARALFRRPKLLLVDRATLGLDVNNQRLIQKILRDQMGKMTIIILPEQVGQMDYHDRIVVLDCGQELESGSFTELVQSASFFNALLTLENLRRF